MIKQFWLHYVYFQHLPYLFIIISHLFQQMLPFNSKWFNLTFRLK